MIRVKIVIMSMMKSLKNDKILFCVKIVYQSNYLLTVPYYK